MVHTMCTLINSIKNDSFQAFSIIFLNSMVIRIVIHSFLIYLKIECYSGANVYYLYDILHKIILWQFFYKIFLILGNLDNIPLKVSAHHLMENESLCSRLKMCYDVAKPFYCWFLKYGNAKLVGRSRVYGG